MYNPKKILVIICALASTLALAKTANIKAKNGSDHKLIYNQRTIPLLLGWQPAKNVCGGVYVQPMVVKQTPAPKSIEQSITTISADKTVAFSQKGTSVLTGNVVVTQPGRMLKANKAILYRDPKTHKINRIALFGHVSYNAFGKLLVGDHANINLAKNSVIIDNGLYHLEQPWYWGTTVNSWGLAKRIDRVSPTLLNFTEATYSTCAPGKRFWQLRAGHLHLDKKKNKGVARNARLYIHGVPVFYTPYLSFPLTHKRKSGFLFPVFSYSKKNGFDVSLPYYFNLASNYDLTLTPRYITRRGFLGEGLFRYVTYHSQGILLLRFIPYDKEFAFFRDNARNKFDPKIPFVDKYIDRLKKDHDWRGLIEMQNQTHFNRNWSTSLNVNYVTDDYYFKDIGSNPYATDTDQLLNQADINYDSEHWHFLTRVQAFQTLQVIDNSIITQQYRRLPQVDLSANYPYQKFGLDYSLGSEFVRFDHAKLFTTGKPVPIGNRFNVDPRMSLPIIRAQGFIVPQAQIELTQYDLRNNKVNNPKNPEHISRAVPMFDVDSGLYFQRKFHIFHHNYTQTLEPRVYYLYVPFVNQNDIPLFDTSLPSFSYDQLFRPNRFVGIDRIGDANRVAIALTTQILDSYSGMQKLSASIGELYYFTRPRITECVTADCSAIKPPKQLSPLVGLLTYHLTRYISASANTALNVVRQVHLINSGVGINLNFSPTKVIRLYYDFVKKGDPYTIIDPTIDPDSSRNNLNRAVISGTWPLIHHWSVLGDYNYNISHGHPLAYFYGLQYNGCCFALRFIASRVLESEQKNGTPGNLKYNNQYYVQIQLKGFGNFANNSPNQLIQNTIPGFQDPFHSFG